MMSNKTTAQVSMGTPFLGVMPINPSSFFVSVMGIIFLRTKEKMIRVYARRVVAYMADQKTLWNLSLKDFISYSVNRLLSFVYPNSSIRKFVISSKAVPFPTATRFFFDVFKKPSFDRHSPSNLSLFLAGKRAGQDFSFSYLAWKCFKFFFTKCTLYNHIESPLFSISIPYGA